MSTTLESLRDQVKTLALEKLAELQKYKQTEQEFKQLARVYQDLTGESIHPDGLKRGRGRPPQAGSRAPRLNPATSSRTVIDRILEYLIQHPGTGPTATAKELHVHPQSAASAVRVLRERGWISKTSIPTQKGKAQFPDLQPSKATAKVQPVPRKNNPKGSNEAAVLTYLAKNGSSSARAVMDATGNLHTQSTLMRMKDKNLVAKHTTPDGIKWDILAAGKTLVANGIAHP